MRNELLMAFLELSCQMKVINTQVYDRHLTTKSCSASDEWKKSVQEQIKGVSTHHSRHGGCSFRELLPHHVRFTYVVAETGCPLSSGHSPSMKE